jgi:hypothetical protein
MTEIYGGADPLQYHSLKKRWYILGIVGMLGMLQVRKILSPLFWHYCDLGDLVV